MYDILKRVEGSIGYIFRNRALLTTALTHSSFANEHSGVESYERLEFLGDSIVEFVITEFLLEIFPKAKEGELSKIRAGIVNRYTLSKAVDFFNISPFIRTGGGNARLDVIKSIKIRSDIFEALVGAMYSDCHELTAIKKFILSNLSASAYKPDADYKSKMLEFCAQHKKTAIFKLSNEKVEGQFFKVTLSIDGRNVAEGIGTNIKTAEQEASRVYLNLILKK